MTWIISNRISAEESDTPQSRLEVDVGSVTSVPR